MLARCSSFEGSPGACRPLTDFKGHLPSAEQQWTGSRTTGWRAGEDRRMLSISDRRRSNTETASRILTQSDDKLAGRWRRETGWSGGAPPGADGGRDGAPLIPAELFVPSHSRRAPASPIAASLVRWDAARSSTGSHRWLLPAGDERSGLFVWLMWSFAMCTSSIFFGLLRFTLYGCPDWLSRSSDQDSPQYFLSSCWSDVDSWKTIDTIPLPTLSIH